MAYQQGDITKLTDDYLKNPPLRKTKFYNHISNLGEMALYFSGSLFVSYLCVYFRGWEIVLGLIYLACLAYSFVVFAENPEGSFLRLAAVTAGVLIGVKELALHFTLPFAGVVISIITIAAGIYKVYNWTLFLFSPVPGEEEE